MSCSFCGRPVAEVQMMIEGPDELRICDRCVERASGLVGSSPRVTMAECSFCRQSSPPVHYTRNGITMCDPCVALCVEILAEQNVSGAAKPS